MAGSFTDDNCYSFICLSLICVLCGNTEQSAKAKGGHFQYDSKTGVT